ncbi:MAG: RIP metalloprotease RseP [Candidatus Dactylopiibacterium carminicum]|uniref:Zinc metalloprotease n=1 Tax=Candidatus Dactylopiibacterium carminicum TaxID=857335 RepID=A0A272EQF2_9RHOO|nr:RIP metalloprotease RseP [Candidatus Dactylopiibacterium carminicum]KAF7598547.1 RIP metalloprotease RseP [Candidatus Dactylopiibacterium carminicum]PAS92322.1 MAG: RIP metalloprotease RseP [Candidatus Dactylopiibacterium carminicum]PAS95907.1 MAG: RIP metalloprotease RseP [Candidatus Dactylopiibacterium carminicum]PAS98107.1 MAG: RIP metalloprotease RseP [Candidatus Dactylopiibacterium carminicum]
MGFLHYLLYFLLAIGILVAVHEYGHFLAARLLGVKVLRFSLGFGPVIWRRKAGEDNTEWALSAVPLGGYVKMLDEREGPVAEHERNRAFNTQSLWRRSVIVAAGPLANFLLAILFYWVLACVGTRDLPTSIEMPPAASPAAMAGLHAGDRIRAVDGVQVNGWSELRWQILNRAFGSELLKLDVEREGGRIEGLILGLASLRLDERAEEPMRQLGLIAPGTQLPAVLDSPLPGGVAEMVGLRRGDLVLTVDAQDVSNWREFVGIIAAAPGRELVLELLRDGEIIRIQLRPRADEVRPTLGRIGVGVLIDENAVQAGMIRVSYGLFEGFAQGVLRTWEMSRFSLQGMWQMLTGRLSLRNVSGPVTIADYAGQSARAGWDAYVGFLAMVSVSLGVLNLLPVPVLDGGHLLYHALEGLRGKALSERSEELGQRLGMALLLALMVLAFFNDITRVLSG